MFACLFVSLFAQPWIRLEPGGRGMSTPSGLISKVLVFLMCAYSLRLAFTECHIHTDIQTRRDTTKYSANPLLSFSSKDLRIEQYRANPLFNQRAFQPKTCGLSNSAVAPDGFVWRPAGGLDWIGLDGTMGLGFYTSLENL